MKRFLATACTAGAALILAGCGGDGPGAAKEKADVPAPGPAPTATEAATAASPTPPEQPPQPADAAAEGAPAFAVIYPGGQIEGPGILASGAAGPGGLVTYTTDAGPDAVVSFHKARAEAAGLSSVMAMNQGEARAYGAVGQTGANLQVVAAPTEAGETSVQLSWSVGG